MADNSFAAPALAPGLSDLLRSTAHDVVREIVRHADVIGGFHARLLNGALEERRPEDVEWLLVPLTPHLIDALAAFDAENEDVEDDTPAEETGDLEPSLGAREIVNQETAWRATTDMWRLDAEFEGDTVADADLEDGHDREDDPAERSGIGDADGLSEQFGGGIFGFGEPSLGATEDINQIKAWSKPHSHAAVDGEMDGDDDNRIKQGDAPDVNF